MCNHINAIKIGVNTAIINIHKLPHIDSNENNKINIVKEFSLRIKEH